MFVKNAAKLLNNMINIKEQYKNVAIPQLKEKFGFKNQILVPKISKVVLNVGFGKHTKEKEYQTNVEKSLEKIAGQKPMMAKAKKSISAFKIREGMVIGSTVTLRGKRMEDFLNKLVNVTFPRVRDFRGISEQSIDNRGNITIGFKEQSCFPEIKAEDADNLFGLEVCIATTARNKEEGLELFKLLGFPFKKNQ